MKLAVFVRIAICLKKTGFNKMTDQTSPKYECAACKKRGKTWQGADPKCAFKTGIFSKNNWSCATIQAFNKHVRWPEKTHPRVKITLCKSEEHYATVNLENVDFPPNIWEDYPVCLVVIWYKNRGRTDQMWLMFESLPPRQPAEEEVLIITAALANSHDYT
jgi:hypothetical protein